jgi:hypothetical protein
MKVMVTKERCSDVIIFFSEYVSLYTAISLFQRIIFFQTTRILLFLSPLFNDDSSVGKNMHLSFMHPTLALVNKQCNYLQLTSF